MTSINAWLNEHEVICIARENGQILLFGFVDAFVVDELLSLVRVVHVLEEEFVALEDHLFGVDTDAVVA